MKLWKNCLTVAGFGLLLMLASCSKDVSRDATEGFISGLSMMYASASAQESSMILDDFKESSPPGPEPPELPEIPELSDYVQMSGVELSEGKLRAPAGIDTLYGTWRLLATTGWTHVDENNPDSAILFEWEYYDTTKDSLHEASVLFDSLEFYQDSLPTNVWVGIKIDDKPTWLAWIKLEAEYTSLEEASEVSLIYEIVGYYQVGVSVSAPIKVDTIIDIDSTDFVGTIHLWAINLTNDYRVDLTVTRNADTSVELVLEDSDGWRMEVDISEVVETDGEFKRRDVTGEITRDGTHAAYLDGEIWKPDDDASHNSYITITFSDGSVGNLLAYY